MHSIKELMKIYGKLETAVEEMILSFVVMSRYICDMPSFGILILMETPVTGLNANTFCNSSLSLEVAVIASQQIPAHVLSLPFLSKISFQRIFNTNSVNHYLMACVSQTGTLVVDKHTDWIRFVRIARNCFEQNLTAILWHNSTIALKTIRPIAKGEELLVWPSTELTSLMNIPFLRPINIINNQCYRCDKCGHNFSQPNPLKIHLTLECKHSLDFNSVPIIDEKYIGSHKTSKEIRNKLISGQREQRGHTCLYCGKNYTRKYGLRIHERTHTGQKPLMCNHCGRPFSDPSNLNKHIRLHSKQTHFPTNPYKCKLCSKVLIRRRDLERHIKSRHS